MPGVVWGGSRNQLLPHSFMEFQLYFLFKAGKLAVDRGWAINVGEYKFGDTIKSVLRASECFHLHLFAKLINVFSIWLLFSL